MSIDKDVARAVAGIIYAYTAVGIPRATLAQPANAGDDHVFLTSTTGMVKRGRLQLWDDTDERTWTILDIDRVTGKVTLRPAGTYTGLQFPHLVGTGASSNLLFYEPVEVAHMVAGGQPLFFVIARRDHTKVAPGQRYRPLLQVHIESRRQLFQPEDGQMDKNDYAQMQEDATREDLGAIVKALMAHRHLGTPWKAPIADGLGDGSGGPDMSGAWGSVPFKGDTVQMVGFKDVLVLTGPQPIN